MAVLLACIAPLRAINAFFGVIGRWATVVAMALMVAVILIQVFCRYVLGDALPWPDEAARFFMLWMTGLIAPVAYRRGGFVAIDMVENALPRVPAALLSLILLSISLVVLVWGVQLGHTHTMSGCLFKSSSLWIPFSLEFALPMPGTGMSLTLCTSDAFAFSLSFGWTKLPLATMYASLFVGVCLLTLVNIELILRSLVLLLGGSERLPALPHEVAEAE
jgi:TRAP-type C4-dicarboxylate transport system permease small subunit